MRRVLLIAVLFASCIAAVASAAKPAPQLKLADVGLDATALDKSAAPCDDFYQFACGSWNKKTAIPADEASWYRSFDEIQKRNEADLRQILDAAVAAGDKGDAKSQQLGQFYGACVRSLGTDITPTAAKLPTDGMPLAVALATAHAGGARPFFAPSIDPDYKDATKVIVWLDQSGLGLPDRDNYLLDDDKTKSLRKFYLGHIEKVLAFFGAPNPGPTAVTVLRIETALAKASKSPVERRDPAAMYNKVDRAGLPNWRRIWIGRRISRRLVSASLTKWR